MSASRFGSKSLGPPFSDLAALGGTLRRISQLSRPPRDIFRFFPVPGAGRRFCSGGGKGSNDIHGSDSTFFKGENLGEKKEIGGRLVDSLKFRWRHQRRGLPVERAVGPGVRHDDA